MFISSTLTRSARVRRFALVMKSLHTSSSCPFRLQAMQVHVILYTLSPSLPILFPIHLPISTGRRPIIPTLSLQMPKPSQSAMYVCISNDIREKLHWLPIRQRITYKLCLIVFRCLCGKGPAYLCKMLTLLSGIQHLRPLHLAAHGNLHIPRTRTRTFGSCSFSVSGRLHGINSRPTWKTLN